jgi:low affinity Fe/Cu permease
MKDKFRIIAGRISVWAGSALVFVGAIILILVWALTGPVLDFSTTWQLTVNTGTTIITFLMVFLIQNTQNRDGRAVQLKLDELIRAHKQARDSFVDLEDITDDELAELTNEFRKMHENSHPTAVMHKLHQKIEQEHAKRQSLAGKAGHMVGSIFDPLNINKHKK